MKNSESKKKKS